MRALLAGMSLAFVAFLFAGTPASAGCTIGRMVELPVTMQSLVPMVDAGINGAPARFIADSGAFYSIITPGSAAAFGLHLESLPPGFSMVGINGSASGSVATVKTFTLAGIDIPRVQFIVGGSEVGSAGVLGQNVLGLADVEYDLPHGAIRLMRAHECGNSNMAYWSGTRPYSMIAIDPRTPAHPHTIGVVLLNDIKVRATFDTGASTSLLSMAAAARIGIKPDSPGVEPGGYMVGFGRRHIRTWIAPLASFKVGDEEIKHTRIRFGEMTDDTDMLLGADFFIAHRIYVANAAHRLFLTYEGGPVFNLTARHEDAEGKAVADDAAAPADAPMDAEGYSRRGAVSAAQNNRNAAIADFDKAIALAPAEPRYRFQRAMAYLEEGRPVLARADLDQVIRLRPDDVDGLIARAGLGMRRDRPGAIQDIDAAARAAPKSADQRLMIGSLYNETGRLDQAIEQYTLWLDAHPVDAKRALALNGRCWARALSGRDLPKALADCNGALRLASGSLSFLDSRALVELRMGDTAKAIKDYDTVLAGKPETAWSLYGRGVAKLRTGDAAGGKADIAAAAAIAPELPDRARGFGIIP